ncbi:Asp-tRNA(Asn)/Glu-tRNA(Gln) amidotransferase subunit GatC [Candidatus Uhrbacteria bacterium]|nr:Asp-tRNA(Asn)/Glu-tRNA(Gln) amidotransferase subunit GatC [Candidatus Uhrbacteria bacterium]
MSISREDIERLADLARLKLSDDEIRDAERDLDSILGYVGRLQKVQTAGLEPFGLAPTETGWRADEVSDCDDLTRELILSNFPSRKGALLNVPAVFEAPKG